MAFLIGSVWIVGILVWIELRQIKSDTQFSWQMQKEINFELQAIRSILADTQAQSQQHADKALKFLNRWDEAGLPNVPVQD